MEKRDSAMTSPTDPQVPSAERREEVIAAWMEGGGQTWCFDGKTEPELEVDRDFLFWDFIAALDAQSAQRTRAEVEKMREAAAKVARDFEHACERNVAVHRPPSRSPNELVALAHENGAAAAHQIAAAICALPIEGACQ